MVCTTKRKLVISFLELINCFRTMWCLLPRVACELQTYFRSPLLPLRKMKKDILGGREAVDDRKYVCSSEAIPRVDILIIEAKSENTKQHIKKTQFYTYTILKPFIKSSPSLRKKRLCKCPTVERHNEFTFIDIVIFSIPGISVFVWGLKLNEATESIKSIQIIHQWMMFNSSAFYWFGLSWRF